MNRKKLGLLAVGLAVIVLSGMPVEAKKEKKPKMTEEMQAQMAKMKELGTPGAEHAVLKAFEGDWTVSSLSWMKPKDKPEKSTGTSSISWVFDGRFLKQEYKGDWAGQPFEGLGFVGYDKMKKEYVSVWMDSMSTNLFHSTGQYDEATKTIKDGGTFNCPMTGEVDKWFRAEWKSVDNDTHTYSMYIKDAEGKEFRSMELTYKRAK